MNATAAASTPGALRPRRLPWPLLVLLALGACMSSVEPPAVELGTLAHSDPMVKSEADGGAHSLRQIIAEAAPDDIIAFHPNVTFITLTSGQLVVDKNLTITGPEGGTVTISGDSKSRVFSVTEDAVVTLRNLTITGGQAPITGVPPTTISFGGGIRNEGTLAIENSTITGNNATGGTYSDGGGIRNEGTLTIENSTISGNSARVGAGVSNPAGGALTIENSTITGNPAVSGGGVHNNGNLAIKNSTFTANTAAHGGGIFISANAPTTLENSIVALNTATYNPDIQGVVTSASHNLIGNAGSSGITDGVNSNIVNPNPGLELDPDGKPKLADNGGPSRTIALTAGSPAIDAASGAISPATDQRGVPRPQGTAHDIGAYEYDYPVFTGFFSPVNDEPTLNTAKAGQTIPLKWHLQDVFGNPITNLSSATVSVTSLACTAGTTTDAIEEYARGTSGLQNLGDGHYQFNWATPKNYAGTCKTMRLDLGDGITQTALFQFTK
jgi:hypothetical protein